jgi:hypothetical protein
MKLLWIALWGKVSFSLFGGMVAQPMYVATNPDFTSAALVAYKPSVDFPIRNFRFSADVVLKKQLRQGAPANPWECFALAFNWKIRPDDTKVHANIVWFKTNGLQVSTAFDEVGEEYLHDQKTPKAIVGRKYRYEVVKDATWLSVRVDEVLVLKKDFAGTAFVTEPGFVAVYAEDAKVKLTNVKVVAL